VIGALIWRSKTAVVETQGTPHTIHIGVRGKSGVFVSCQPMAESEMQNTLTAIEAQFELYDVDTIGDASSLGL
jgi:hypothetical protein